MEPFDIDEQTLKDLNIFAENGHSIFELFKHTKTLGGRQKLREQMKPRNCNS